MSKLRDVMETSNVNIKQIQDYHKKGVLNDYEEIKIRKRKKSLQSISKDIDVSVSSIQRYKKDMGYPVKHRQITSSQKYQSQLNMQLGKAKARWSRGDITEDVYKKIVTEIENKYGSLINEDSHNRHNSYPDKLSASQNDHRTRKGGAINEAGANEASAVASGVASTVDTAREEARRLLYASKI